MVARFGPKVCQSSVQLFTLVSPRRLQNSERQRWLCMLLRGFIPPQCEGNQLHLAFQIIYISSYPYLWLAASLSFDSSVTSVTEFAFVSVLPRLWNRRVAPTLITPGA